jgi:dTDP-4-dehydrorhamnose reductase
MRILVTGGNGTVGPKLIAHARQSGHEVIAWDRGSVDPNDPAAVDDFVREVSSDAICHLAFGAESWAGQLAWLAGVRDIPFVYTSTAMVFDERPQGPYSNYATRNSTNDYGQYKIRCEDAIWASNPAAMVARIGYQIDADGVGNNMVAHIDAQQAKDGIVRASTVWVPACAFLQDTVAALLSLATDPERGLHHLDSNADDAWTYFEIVTALRHELKRQWNVEATELPDHDQRLVRSDRIAPLHTRLTRVV